MPAAELMPTANRIADLLCQNSPAAMMKTKQAIWESLDMGLHDALQHGWDLLRSHWEHPDYREGLGLFAGIEEMRFKRIVRPGETGRFTAVFEKMRRGFGRAKVTTHVGDELAAEGVILAIFQPQAKVAP